MCNDRKTIATLTHFLQVFFFWCVLLNHSMNIWENLWNSQKMSRCLLSYQYQFSQINVTDRRVLTRNASVQITNLLTSSINSTVLPACARHILARNFLLFISKFLAMTIWEYLIDFSQFIPDFLKYFSENNTAWLIGWSAKKNWVVIPSSTEYINVNKNDIAVSHSKNYFQALTQV